MAGNKGIVSAQFYKFSAANKTITFSNDYAGLDLGEITYITNIKNGVATVIYDPFDATKGGTLNGLTLTLAYNTTTMADTDPLQIITGFTPLNADPLPVKIVEGPDQVDDTALLQNISDNLDYLNLALDQNEGIQVNTRDVSIKKDTQGAIVPSDAVTPIIYTVKTSTDQLVIDTAGYQSISITLRTGPDWAGSVNFQGTNDPALGWNQITWLPHVTPSTPSNGGNPYIANATVNISIGCSTRFVRVFASAYTSGAFTVVAYLRQFPLSINGGMQNVPVSINNTATTNISLIGGGATQNASTLGAGGGAAGTAGTIVVSGHTSQTTNPPNAATSLQTNVPYPIGVGGREWPYIGALSGVFRYFTLDARGNLILGGDTAFRTPNLGGALEQSSAGTARGIGGVFNNIQGAQSLTVADVSQDFGDTHIMLLRQILTELKILNQQFAEMPNIMNNPSYELSEPQEFRNDPTFDANN